MKYCTELYVICSGTQTRVKPRLTVQLHGYTVHQIMLNTFYYQLTHTTLKNVELLKHSKIVYSNTVHDTHAVTGHNMQP